MSIFTLRLKDALSSAGGSYELVDGVTVVTKPELIGLGHYPEHKPGYRARLNGLIFDRYMNREIGMETVSMFAQAVRRRMSEQMPVMNELYRSTELEFDALKTVDVRTTGDASSSQTGETTTSSNTVTESEAGTRVVNQEFPQMALKNNADYASSGADSRAFNEGSGESADSATSGSDSESASSSHTEGYQGVPADLVMRYRESILNVDQMVLDSLADCFMGVWDTPESYTNGSTFNAYYS